MQLAGNLPSDILMTCICDHAGYCPLMRTTMYAEEWNRCRTDEAFHVAEMKRRGIRANGYAPAVAAPVVTCGPCETAAAQADADRKALKKTKSLQPFQNTRPVVTNRRERPALGLRDQFAGQRVFLLGGGPSLKSVALTRLQRPGITLAAMNNVATMIRPHIWFSVDLPRNFSETIWRDPGVMKFTMDKHIRNNGSVEAWDAEGKRWVNSGIRLQDVPNVWGFDHRHGWDASLFFDDTVPTWGANGAHEDPDGQTKQCTVMLPALWMLYWLGFRTIYLLGCDFKVGDGNYAFDEKCGPQNDHLFGWLNRRFTELAPFARERGLTILNCTEGSALTAFERLSLDAAIEATLENWPEHVQTRGAYRGP